jgi:hypothetical protein
MASLATCMAAHTLSLEEGWAWAMAALDLPLPKSQGFSPFGPAYYEERMAGRDGRRHYQLKDWRS